MPRAKPFKDENHPEVGDDKIVLDFKERSSRQCLKIYARLVDDEELKDRIEKRCTYYDRQEKKK
jgi:hypothetical protein